MSSAPQSIVSAAMQQYGTPIAVCSYHFKPVERKRRYKTKLQGGFQSTWKWTAAKSLDGPPEMEIVLDGYQKRFIGSDEMTGRKNWVDEPWAATLIAKDLVRSVTGSSNDVHDGPAFWACKTRTFPTPERLKAEWGLPSFRREFPEFVAECEARREQAFRNCEKRVGEADTFHSMSQPTNITDLHRDAAKMIDANEAEHPWIRSTKLGAQIPCPFCGKATSSQAPKCGSCHEIINAALYKTIQNRILAESEEPLMQPPPPPPTLTPPAAPLT